MTCRVPALTALAVTVGARGSLAQGGTPIDITPDFHAPACARIAWRPKRNGSNAW
jgi:hypothetical protein